MAEEIKNAEETMQDVQKMSEEQLDKVVGGGGKIDTYEFLPSGQSSLKQVEITPGKTSVN